MIKTTLAKILDASDTFTEIMTQSFKGSLAFKIARLARELNKEVETFNTERQKLLSKYCEKDENGELKISETGTVKVIQEKIEDFNEELQNLLKIEVEINADKLPLSSIDDFNLTPQQMILIEDFFE